jgi:hypothetical protein
MRGTESKGFRWEKLRSRDHLDELVVNGRITLKKDLHEIERMGMRWIDVAQDKKKWRAFIDTVMNLQVPRSAGIFLAESLFADV